MSLKIYTTNQGLPPGDIRSLIGAPHHFSYGQFAAYVLAETKTEAAKAINGAYSSISFGTGDIRVAANRLDQISQDHVKAIYDAEFLRQRGDVVVTSRDDHYGVVLVRTGSDEDGDPQRVASWESRQNEENLTVTSLDTVDGRRFDLPVDEAFRRAILGERAEKAAERKLIADAAVAIDRTSRFVDRWTAIRTLDPNEIHGLDGGDDAGGITLTVTDLRNLIAAAATVLK